MALDQPTPSFDALDPSDKRFRDFADAMPHMLWTARPDGTVDYLNKVYTDNTGIDLNVESQNWLTVLHPDDIPRAVATWNHSVKTGSNYSIEFRVLHRATGEYRWNAVKAEPVRDAHGRIIKWYGIATDIHDSKTTSENAALLAARLNATLESLTDGFLLLDQHWRIGYVNRAAEAEIGIRRDEILGKVIWDVFKEEIGGRFEHEACAAMRDRLSAEFEYFSPVTRTWYEIRLFPGEEGLSVYFRNIAERKKVEQEIHRLAFHDQLTGLPNRQLLHDRLRHAMQIGQRRQSWGAVMFLDLDDFKTLNDTQGHALGDLLLKAVARRLQSTARASDTVARLGGDEFVVIMEDMAGDAMNAAMQVEHAAEKILAALDQPYELNRIRHVGTASIGIALFHGETLGSDELLKRADLAMYQAKAAGRDTIRFFDPAMQAAINHKLMLEAGLRESIQDRQFTLHYQPQWNRNNQITGAEALLRWSHPAFAKVSPAEFIPLAEETGLIHPLGRWVLEAVCTQLARWANHRKTAHLLLSVNISARQFCEPHFVRDVMEILHVSGADPTRLRFELTETAVVNKMADTVAKMKELKALGIGISLDDFGIGYSSLSYLRDLPLDELKIDRSFISRVPGSAGDVSILQAIILMGRDLGLTVVAEGVESEEQLAFLNAAGCQSYQGFLFSKPLLPEAFETFVEEQQASVPSSDALCRGRAGAGAGDPGTIRA